MQGLIAVVFVDLKKKRKCFSFLVLAIQQAIVERNVKLVPGGNTKPICEAIQTLSRDFENRTAESRLTDAENGDVFSTYIIRKEKLGLPN